MTLHRSIALPSLAFLLGLLSHGVLSAQASPKVFEFLHAPPSARAAAMGGTFVTMTDDASAFYYNPATLNTVDSTQVVFSFRKNLLDINSGFATYATDIDGIGHVAAGVNYTSNGTFERTDKMGRSLGEFGAGDLDFTVAWGVPLGQGFSAGLAGKAIYSNIEEYNSFALALDGGLLYQDSANHYQVGMSILNLGSQVSSYGLETEPMPLDLQLGVAAQPRGLPLTIALAFSRMFDQPGDNFFSRFSSFSVGGEFKISQPLRLRFGYDNRIREDVAFSQRTGLSGFSLGLGVVIKSYRFDYAINQAISSLHHVSISAMF